MTAGEFWTGPKVERWLSEAAIALRAMPDRERAWILGSGSFWPQPSERMNEIFARLVEAEADHSTKRQIEAERNYVRLGATSQQIACLQEVMGWFVLLPDRRAVQLVWAIALRGNRAFGQVGRRQGLSRQAVRQRYRRLIGHMTTRLNDGDHKKGLS